MNTLTDEMEKTCSFSKNIFLGKQSVKAYFFKGVDPVNFRKNNVFDRNYSSRSIIFS